MLKKYKEYTNKSLLSETELSFYQKILDGFEYKSLPCICGDENNYKIIAKVDRYGFKINTLLCKICGMMRATPYFTKDSLEEFYKNHYREIYSNRAGVESVFKSAEERGQIYLDKIKGLLANGRVLEIGCGTGGGLSPFHKSGYDCYGCDFGKEYLNYGLNKGLNLREGSFELFSQSFKFDLIILSHVFEHFVDPFEKLSQIKALLNEGGLLLIEVPGVLSCHSTYNGLFLDYLQNAHPYSYTKDHLNYLVLNNGFQLVNATEKVVALYRKDSLVNTKFPISRSYNKIKFYLICLEVYPFYLKIRAFIKKFLPMSLIRRFRNG